MTDKIKYKFNCSTFHNNFRSYQQWDNCTYEEESYDYDNIKEKAVNHLTQPKGPYPVEHHYQDFPALDVETDVETYLNNVGGGK